MWRGRAELKTKLMGSEELAVELDEMFGPDSTLPDGAACPFVQLIFAFFNTGAEPHASPALASPALASSD